MKRICAGVVVLAALMTSRVSSAQSTPYYVTDGDDNKMFLLQNGVLQGTFDTTSTIPPSTQQAILYPIAVTSSVLLGDRDDQGGVEFTLPGAPTGHTFPGGNNFSQILDGTTDGTSNYGVTCCMNPGPNVVIRADRHWQNAQALFSIPQDSPGITFDSKNGHLFVVLTFGPSATIHEYDLSGHDLGSFVSPVTESDTASLAYEASTDTLWAIPNDHNKVYQFSTAGEVVQTFSVSGFDPGNNFGGEMVMAAGRSIVDTPTLSAVGLLTLAGMLAIGGLISLARVSG